MSKVKLEFNTPQIKALDYNGARIEINPFLNIVEQISLIKSYVEEYFEETPETGVACLNAGYNLKSRILQLKTNIDTENLGNDFYVDNNFWYLITQSITNYDSFLDDLEEALSEEKRIRGLKNSVGTVLNGLVEKGYTLLDRISEINPEEIEKIQKTGVELIERLEKSSVLGNPNPAKNKRAPRPKKE